MALLLETKTQEIIFRNLLFLKPYLGWSLVTQISQMTQIFFFAVCLSHRFHGIPQIFALCGLRFRRWCRWRRFFLHLIYHPSRFSDINLIRCWLLKDSYAWLISKNGALSLTHQSRFWLYPSRFCLCCKAKRLFCDWNWLHLLLE